MNLDEFKNKYLPILDDRCLEFLNTLNFADKLKEAMIYSFSAGGKRIRPLLLLSTIHAFNEDVNKGINTSIALELIHTSSLIHDDLPAMDDDDYRRGKLTNHKVFGDATAILAGDSLLVDSYNLICDDDYLTDKQKVELISLLSECTGANGMIGGQQLDIENENKILSLEEVMKIHENKTGKLIQFALVAPAIICNQTKDVIDLFKEVSYHIGIAFQIKDDLLDFTGNILETGKSNSDEKKNKCTYVNIMGIDGSIEKLDFHYKSAIDILDSLEINKDLLIAIFKLIINRTY